MIDEFDRVSCLFSSDIARGQFNYIIAGEEQQTFVAIAVHVDKDAPTVERQVFDSRGTPRNSHKRQRDGFTVLRCRDRNEWSGEDATGLIEPIDDNSPHKERPARPSQHGGEFSIHPLIIAILTFGGRFDALARCVLVRYGDASIFILSSYLNKEIRL